jgi:outer membrane protein assembly factor BamA
VDTAAVDTSSVPQRDAMDVLKGLLGKRVEPQFNIEPATGLQWALLPTFSYNPVYGAAFGVLVSGSGRRGSTRARFSNLSVSANVSTTSQVQVQVRGDIFSEDEDFLTKADFRYLDTTRSTWGLGPVDDQAGEYPMSFLLNRLYATVLRRVSGPVYLGLGYHFDQFSSIADQRADQGEATPFTDYSGGYPTKTRATGLSVDLLADTRDNQVNPGAGYLLNWSFRDYFEGMGSDSDWQELWVEARVYPHEPKHGRNVLAFWLYGWFTFGAAPYLNLPSNGWDTYGRGARGYLAGRIRGGDQIYVESEYRWTVSRDGLWGAVVFANGTATTTDSGTFGKMDAAVGTGLRIKLNKHTDTNISLDYGWGLEAGHGFFLGLGEVF